MKKVVLLSIFLSLFAASTYAQTSLLQNGNRFAGHVPMYATTGGPNNPPVVDSGTAGGGNVGLGLSELGLTIRGTGTPPFANAGTGKLQTNLCDYDAPVTNAAGYHFFCLSPNAQGGGLLAYGNGGSAAPLPFKFYINGSYYTFPFTIGGIVGPNTSVVNDVACWNNTTGSLLKDCETLNSNLVVGTSTITSGTSGRILYDNAGILGEFPTGTTGNSVLLQTSSGGTISPSVLPNPSSGTLGGVSSIVATTHQWVNTISTSGVPSTTQPNFADLAGSISPSQFGNIAARTVIGNNTTGSAAPSAIKQNVQWYNVQNYGAVGNGSTDDTTAITSAISAAGSNAVIYFPGTANCYGISANINITGYNITLVGDGMQASQICALSSFTAGDMVTFTSTQFGGMQNIGIYSAPVRTAGSGVGAILREHGDFGLIFDKISVAGGLYADYIDGATIADRHTNNNYSNNGTPVTSVGTAAIKITGTSFASDVPQDIFFDTGEVGNYITDMQVDNVSGLYVTKLSLESNTSNTYGLVFNPTGSQQIYAVHLTDIVSEVFAAHTGYPYLFTGTGQIYNVFMNNCHGATGLNAIFANNAALDGLTITGGNYINSYNAGIVLGAGAHILLQGVQVYASSLQGSNLYPGIVINGANNSSVVNTNSSGANQSYPIQVLSGNDNLIVGNQFAGNVSNTIPNAGTNTYIFCNQPNGCSGGGGGVNPGLVNQLAFYAAAGSTLSGVATSANATLVTDGSGVPSISQTLPVAVQQNISALKGRVAANCANTVGDGAIIQAAINTGETVIINGPCVGDAALTVSTPGQVIWFNGTITVNSVLSGPLWSASPNQPGPVFRGYGTGVSGIIFNQANTASRASLTNFTTAFYMQNVPLFEMHDFFISEATIGIDMRQNSGASIIDNITESATSVGIWADGSFAAVRLNNWQFSNNAGNGVGGATAFTGNCGTLSPTGLCALWAAANASCTIQTTSGVLGPIGLWGGRIDDLEVSGGGAINGQQMCFRNSVVTTGNTFGTIKGFAFDTYSGINMNQPNYSPGNLEISSSYFTGIDNTRQGIVVSGGGVVTCASCFLAGGAGATPFFEVGSGGSLIVSGSYVPVAADNPMFQADSGGYLTVTGSQFIGSAATTVYPKINCLSGSNCVIEGNQVVGASVPTSILVNVAADNYHRITGNGLNSGWSMTCPSSATNAVYANNGTTTTATCGSTSGGGGTITGVTAGSGLSGGGTSGTVTLSLSSSSMTIGGQSVSLGGSTANQGNGSKLQLSTGSPTSGHLASFDANANTVDSGLPVGRTLEYTDPAVSGVLVKSGIIACNSSGSSVTFGAAFPSTITAIYVTPNSTTASSGYQSGASTSGFTVYASPTPTSGYCSWLAFGY